MLSIGVLEKQGTFLGLGQFPRQIQIASSPSSKVLLIGYWRNPDFQIQVTVSDEKQIDSEEEELRGILRKVRHLDPGDPDDFAINRQEQFVATFNSVAGILAAVGLLITGLSLFVGGIGIMNIMFVSYQLRRANA